MMISNLYRVQQSFTNGSKRVTPQCLPKFKNVLKRDAGKLLVAGGYNRIVISLLANHMYGKHFMVSIISKKNLGSQQRSAITSIVSDIMACCLKSSRKVA